MGVLTFRCALAVAALFHLAGNFGVGVIVRSPWLLPVQLLVGGAAVTVLLAPRRQAPVVVLCAAVLMSVWVEAPFLGNHWLLLGFVGLAHVLAVLVARSSSRGPVRVSAWETFVPVGRLVLLVAYGFAAFAKLNSGFLDPTTSCAVFYQDELVSSWGLDGLSVVGRDRAGLLVAVAAVCVELSVPVLLALRRTRRWGVLLGMTFHWFLALDLFQHFWDFSSVLFVCFLLFLDRHQHARLLARWRVLRRGVPVPMRRAATAACLVAALVVTAAGALGEPAALRAVAVLTGHLAWWVLGTGTLVLVALTLRSAGTTERLVGRVPGALLVVPALVLLNGLTPYLEVKTAYGWNMYSNLRTVAGESNHLLVTRTWDLRGEQVSRVTVLDASDPRLLEEDRELVWSEFREYAHDHAEESVTYERRGVVHSAPSLASDPATDGQVSLFSRKVLSFRAVDASGVERCQSTFGPAR